MHREAEIEVTAPELAPTALFGEIVAVSPDVRVVTLRPKSGPDVEVHLAEETNIKIAGHVGARVLAAGTMREADEMDADVFVLLSEREPTGIFQARSQRPINVWAFMESMREEYPHLRDRPEATDEEMDRAMRDDA